MLSEPIEKIGPVEIYLDLDPISPRDWDNLGTLFCKNLCEEGPEEWPDDKTHITLPVYRYEHSGTALSTHPFHCPWDSGLTGYITVSEAKVREEYGQDHISPQLRGLVERVLRQEVLIYGEYVNGEVYGFINTETGHSCWGFFGSEREYMLQGEIP